MPIGIDSFAAAISDLATGLTLSPVERIQKLALLHKCPQPVGSALTGPVDSFRPVRKQSQNATLCMKDGKGRRC